MDREWTEVEKDAVFELTSESGIEGVGHCFYCWVNLKRYMHGEGKEKPYPNFSWEIDHCDPNGGENLNNLVPACCDCNRTKCDKYSEKEFLEIKKGERSMRGGPENPRLIPVSKKYIDEIMKKYNL